MLNGGLLFVMGINLHGWLRRGIGTRPLGTDAIAWQQCTSYMLKARFPVSRTQRNVHNVIRNAKTHTHARKIFDKSMPV